MVLDKGDSGHQRLHGLRLVLYHQFLVLLLYGDVLAHYGIGTEPQGQTDDKANGHLAHNLIPALQTFLVAAEYLDVVVHETEEAQPHGGHQHQDDVDVADTGKQQYGYEDGDDDDDAAHSGYALLLDAEGVDSRVALRLVNLLTAHVLDEILTKPR